MTSSRRIPAPETTLSLTSPAEVVEIVPLLLGFEPKDSIVWLGLRGPRGRIAPTMRVDLCAAEDEASLAHQCVELLTRRTPAGLGRLEQVLAVIYTEEEPPSTDQGPGHGRWRLPRLELAGQIELAVARAGLKLREVIIVHRGRYFVVSCPQSDCCPSEGCPVQPDVPGVAALTLALERGAPAGSREALASAVDPKPLDGFDDIVRATRERLSTLEKVPRRLQALAVFDRAVSEVEEGRALPPEVLAELLLGVQNILTRDLFCFVANEDNAALAVEVWRQVVVVAPPRYAAAPASALASIAWGSGQSILAAAAVDRALADNPTYNLALLLDQLISNGIPSPLLSVEASRRQRREAAREAWGTTPGWTPWDDTPGDRRSRRGQPRQRPIAVRRRQGL